MKTRKQLGLLLISLGFAAFPAIASASHSWGGYHWARTQNPFTLKLGDNVSNAWDAYLSEASSDWSSSIVLDTTIVAGGTKSKPCRPSSGRVEVCSAMYGNTGWLGLAQIWVGRGHITQGLTKVNDTYFSSPTYDTPGWRRLVMCQEIGHTFGLDHQDEAFNNQNLGTCMDYTNDPSGPPSNEHPNQHDYDQLGITYQHLDNTTTVGQSANRMPPAAHDIGPGEQAEVGTAQWGKLIRSTNRGRTELYELDFGGGHKMFTFVIWAEGDE
jgi:hypothetical protein